MWRKILLFLLILALGIAVYAYYLYTTPATTLTTEYAFKVNENEDLASLKNRLKSEVGLKNPWLFEILANKVNLQKWTKKGRYTILPNMTTVQLIRLLREGKTRSTNLVIKGVISLQKFAQICGQQLEPDEEDFLKYFSSAIPNDSLKINDTTIYSLIIPDTYNVFWHTQPDELFELLLKQYYIFWDTGRISATRKLNLSKLQVSTLASIVCKETSKTDEMPTIARLYYNRLLLDMPLQADPTVIFAQNNSTIRRVRGEMLQTSSPYNTYLNKGLPPGPICIPSIQAIDAVLKMPQHSYLFMCAKADFSGYHEFSNTFAQHKIYARKYQKALNERGIE